MKRTAITSSTIKEAGYDLNSNTLEIVFNDGRRYEYFGVPEAVYLGLLEATSAGKYFHRMIRDRYRYAPA